MGDTQAGEPLPRTRWAAITGPTLVAVGGKSSTWMHHGMQALADVLPHARHRTLAGQTHMVKAKALAPVLAGFFADSATGGPAARQASATYDRPAAPAK
jgi:pimeloyl-ACP methyl ester carboxylesterase